MRGGNINTAKKLRGSSMQRIFILLWLSWGLVGAAGAQEFSSRPVMIFAFSAGGLLTSLRALSRKAWVNV
jgi:hypothetical protein